jgi:hypothetical protein
MTMQRNFRYECRKKEKKAKNKIIGPMADYVKCLTEDGYRLEVIPLIMISKYYTPNMEKRVDQRKIPKDKKIHLLKSKKINGLIMVELQENWEEFGDNIESEESIMNQFDK